MKLFNKKKRKSKKIKDRKRIRSALDYSLTIIMILVLTGTLLSGYSRLQEIDFFRIQNIRVYGNTRYSRDRLIRLAGIRKGLSIFTADIVGGSKMLETDPWIHRAVIKRKFPDTIEISVKEHRPIAMIRMNQAYLIDENGILFKKAAKNEHSYPCLTGFTEKTISRTGEAVQLLDTALALIHTLKTNNLLSSDLEINMDRTFGITLANVNGQTKASLGFGNFDEKIVLLKKIKRDLSGRGLTAKEIHLKSTEKAYITI